MLDIDDIQVDVVVGMQKNVENFIFFKIADKLVFPHFRILHVYRGPEKDQQLIGVERDKRSVGTVINNTASIRQQRSSSGRTVSELSARKQADARNPNQFVVLAAAAYFFIPSITALRTVLTST
jgi:hypothetical protein